jgi:hypothetical protein
VTHRDFLICRARPYWERGHSLPLDLFAEMVSAGLDVVSLEEQYM